MAQDKKVFEIKINGLTESVDAVKSLNKELNTLDEKLKSLQNAKINIKVQGNTPDTTKTKVSGNTGNDSQVEKQTQQQNALAKLQQQIAQQQAKNAAMVTTEYQQQYQELVKIKEANKEVEQIQKQIATGVRDTNGEYTNTLQGQRAYLSELQKTFNSQEMGTEEWRKAADELLRVRELVKGIEQSTGDYRRNVGNYPSGAKELVTLFQEYQQQIEETNRSLNELKDSMRGLSQDSDEYKKIAVQVSELEDKLSETTEAAKGLNDELSKKIQINVGDSVQYFDDVDQAAESLQKQLRALALEGQQGTKQWKDTINAYGKVQKAIMATTREVDAFMARSTGLKKTITIMQGFAGVASLGQGLMGLFGGQSEELDKTLSKFAQMTMVLQGIQSIKKQMETEGDAFGQVMSKTWSWIDGLTDNLSKTIKELDSYRRVVKKYGSEKNDLFKGATEQMIAFRDKIRQLPSEVLDAYNNMLHTAKEKESKVNLIDLFAFDSDELRKKFGDEVADAMDKFNESLANNNASDAADDLKDFATAAQMAQGSTTGLTASMMKLGKAGPVVAKGMKVAAAGLKAIVSASVVGVIIKGIVEAIDLLTDGIKWLHDAITGNDLGKAVEDFDGLAASIENANNKLQDLNKQTERKKAEGSINSYQELKEKLDSVTKAAQQSGMSLKQFVSDLENTKDIDLSTFETDTWWNGEDSYSSMEDFKKRYQNLVKAVSQGVDEVKAKTGSGHWWFTADDAKNDLAEM